MSDPTAQTQAVPDNHTSPSTVPTPALNQVASVAQTALPQVPVAPVLPQVPAAPQTAPEPAQPAKFEPTGDPLLDTALDYVAGLGIASTDAVIAAARDGDFGPLEAKLAALGDKAKDKDRYIALAKRAYEDTVRKADEHNSKVTAIVHSVVGGEANWAAIQTWASAQATDEEKAQINAAFAAGGLQAKAAADYLAKAFNKAGRPGVPKTPATKPEAAAAPAGDSPLTARDYARQVEELSRKNRGRDVSHLPEYQTLRARRLAGRAAGL